MIKRILLIFAGFIFALPLRPECPNSEFYFSKIEGISQTNVKAIIQDSWGFMWFGTRNKLNRYDGTSITTFDCYDREKKKRNNNICALFEDKNKQLWIGTDNGIYIFNPFKETFSYFNDSTASGIKIADWIADIQTGNDDNIWIVVPNQGLFRYHFPDERLFFYELGDASSPNYGNPQSILIEKNGKIWVGTNGKGVFLYDKSSDSFSQRLGNHHGSTLEGEHIFTMCDYGDEIILGIHEGKLKKLHKLKNILQDFNAPKIHHQIIRYVMRFNDDIWVGTDAGLYILNEVKNKSIHLHKDRLLPFTLSDNRIEKIYQDRENGIWLATNAGGVNYLPQRRINFEQYIPDNNKNSISSNQITRIKEDPLGYIWIGTEDAGVNIFNPETRQFKQLPDSRGVQTAVLDIDIREKEIWIGYFKNGMDIINYPSLSSKHYSEKLLGTNESSVSAIQEDRFGNTWIGNVWGMYCAVQRSLKFESQKEFGLNFIFDIAEDSDGYIWGATMGNGVYMYNPKTKAVRHFLHQENDSLSLSSNSVSSITEDSKGFIWFSTDRGGICRYDKHSETFQSFSVRDGLPDDVSYKILEDKYGNLWFGTNAGLVRFNPESKEIRTFTSNDGLYGEQFNYKSAFAATSGLFYFGGFNGLVVFNPYELQENDFIPPVYITNVSIANKRMGIDDPDSPLTQSIIHTQKITLNHYQSNIAFQFAVLSYSSPNANKYAYKMEGIDSDWITGINNHSASYVKMPPGKYIFKVKGSNNSGIWNEEGTEIEVEILPPWWYSNIAFIAYGIIVCLLILGMIIWLKRKNQKKESERLRVLESEKEKEIYNAKLAFFTEIAHEIRTPLTLISGPLESLLSVNDKDDFIQKNLKTMNKNTTQLLNLVNQLLDFRKINSINKTLSFSLTNISEVIRDVVQQFEPTIKAQKKEIKLYLPEEDLNAQVDRNELYKILNNLLMNAVKYSDKYIEVELIADNDHFRITIKNDGNLIPLEYQEKIFEPFYQYLNEDKNVPGSGIGLSLSRSLTELHGGTLHYKNDMGLNVFVAEFPLEQKNHIAYTDQPDHEYPTSKDDSEYNLFTEKKETILIVEDHPEMLTFISDLLSVYFMIEKASSGKEAFVILKNKPVDLILSDLMMPGMDGIEFCKQLKSNVEFSHIPVVLLTAKNNLSSKIHGLEAGAEAYIEKPFSSAFLVTQLTSILNNRKRERVAFMHKPFLPLQQLNMSKADESLMENVTKIINEYITDDQFNVDLLAELTFMSRSNLHRKIKMITGLPPNEFIRLIRLKKAAELISNGKNRISEISSLVGINSPSYFIKLFQKQFGMTPKEFEQQQSFNKNNNN